GTFGIGEVGPGKHPDEPLGFGVADGKENLVAVRLEAFLDGLQASFGREGDEFGGDGTLDGASPTDQLGGGSRVALGDKQGGAVALSSVDDGLGGGIPTGDDEGGGAGLQRLRLRRES